MRRLISRRPSPAMAVAFVALLAALTGTAVALPGTNTVNSGDIVNNTIRSKDVKNNNLRGKDVKNGSLGGRDVKNDSLTGADINEGTLGTVPNANHATTADTLGGLGPSAFQRTPLWANVEPNGTIAFQSGGITLSHPSPGLYFIDFGTTTQDKLATATPPSQIDTALIAFPCGGGPGAGICTQGNDHNHLLVRTRSTAGADADRGFFVGLFP